MNTEQQNSLQEQYDELEQLKAHTKQLIEELNQEREQEKELYRKYLVNGYDMLSRPMQHLECLLHPILPRVGVAALVGTSDSG